MPNFPTSLDTLTNPTATDNMAAVPHHTQHSNANDAIEAIEAKVGIGAGTPVAEDFLVGTGTGTTDWKGIADFAAVTTPSGSDVLPIVSGGVTKKATVDALLGAGAALGQVRVGTGTGSSGWQLTAARDMREFGTFDPTASAATNAATLQAALDHVAALSGNGGERLVKPPGLYQFDTGLHYNAVRGLILEGQGGGVGGEATILRFTGGAEAALTLGPLVRGALLHDFCMDNSGSGTIGIDLDGTADVKLDNVFVTPYPGPGFSVAGIGMGLHGNETDYPRFRDISVRFNHIGMLVGDVGSFEGYGCQIELNDLCDIQIGTNAGSAYGTTVPYNFKMFGSQHGAERVVNVIVYNVNDGTFYGSYYESWEGSPNILIPADAETVNGLVFDGTWHSRNSSLPTITSSSVAAATVLTLASPHPSVKTGDSVRVQNHVGSTPDLNGVHTVTNVVDPSRIAINVNVTVAGTGGQMLIEQAAGPWAVECHLASADISLRGPMLSLNNYDLPAKGGIVQNIASRRVSIHGARFSTSTQTGAVLVSDATKGTIEASDNWNWTTRLSDYINGQEMTALGWRLVASRHPYRDYLLSLGLAGYWRVGESSGAVIDQLGANNGAVVGSPTRGVTGLLAPGELDGAITLTGSDYISIPSATVLHPGDVFTLGGLVYLPSLGSAYGLWCGGANDYEVIIDATGHIQLNKTGVDTIWATTAAVITAAAIHDVIVTKNGSTRCIYVDGVLVAGAGTNYTLTGQVAAVWIGSALDASAMVGTVDEPFICGRDISSAEVAMAHNIRMGLL
jgi:hypothetical protein